MKTRKEIIISTLTLKYVNLIIKEYITINNIEQQLGNTKRICYNNCLYDRQRMLSILPKEYLNSIFSIWGDVPIIEDIKPIIN